MGTLDHGHVRSRPAWQIHCPCSISGKAFTDRIERKQGLAVFNSRELQVVVFPILCRDDIMFTCYNGSDQQVADHGGLHT